MTAGVSDLPAESPQEETSVEVPLCHNCGAVAPGKFCSECGQTTHVHMPSLFEFLHEFVSHHVAFEGTLVASLKRLLLSPGGLTLDFFAGRRARYVAPLRLYLTFNVLFFLGIELFQAFGVSGIGVNQDNDAKKALSQVKLSDASAAIQQATAEITADPSLTQVQRQAATEKLAMLQQYAAHSALPDGQVKAPVAAGAPDQKTSATSAAAPATQAAPEKNYNFSIGKPITASPDSGAAPHTPGISINIERPPASSSGSLSSGSAANSSGGVSGPLAALGDLASRADDDDDDNEVAVNRREARSEVLESARDAAAAVAPPDKPANTSPGPKPDNQALKRVETSTIPPWVDHYAPAVRRHIEEVGNRSSEQNIEHLKQNGLRYAPYTLLALLPVCAFLLQISFIGRHRGYVENLVSALHGHTFLFIVLLVFVPLNAFSGILGGIWLLLAMVHMIWALSRIYGSRGIGLFMRLGVLAVTYGMALVLATTFAILISVLT